MGCEDSSVSLMMFSSSSNSREKGVTYWKTSIPSSTLVTRWLQNQHENLPPWNQARSSPASAGRSLEGAVLFPHQQSSPWDGKVKLCKAWSLSHRIHVVVFGVPRKCRPLFHCIHLGSRLNNMKQKGPVLKICFGPPTADFWSVWSSQKARKFRQIQPTTKVHILCFEWQSICFQTRDVLSSYNMNYEE